ncbi:flagellin [Aneurinibacillus sp. Ricciae_BoGa-3]|uniref:flagellin N-terminal helical domain-containing protein n=1 Tax=Aneurinibacillus sp. Ricciae_BoGa-3 TaxID=3022697 RepID=UPI002340EDD5|nr:flagellin [Aneurinibacillus sp. Ricciae_BoGa-3]WCK54180.1 flagellin [Aneurinibacillus sp. Ricciae_BoGa-3]
MRINHNIAALNAYTQLTQNQEATQNVLEKLSSGLRINRAADDAAGLAISEKMRGQISGLDQANRNAQDGISLIQTAEGALNETQAMLQRMRELAVQSANDTNTDQDRQNIQLEMTQLENGIDQIGNTTQFNSKMLLNGSMGAGQNSAVANVNTSQKIDSTSTTTTPLTSLNDPNGNSLGITSTDSITISYVKNGTTVSNTFTVSGSTIAALGTTNRTNPNLDYSLAISSGSQLTVTAANSGLADAINGLTLTVKDASGNVRSAATNALSSFVETKAAKDAQADGTLSLQVGANENQTVTIDINDMRASALGINGLQVTTQNEANTAIKVIDTAIQKVSAERAKFGAFQNRLQHTINNITTSSENLSGAESRIRDADMAQEMTEFTKLNIINQSATAMLAQANQLPQGVLQLLKG